MKKVQMYRQSFILKAPSLKYLVIPMNNIRSVIVPCNFEKKEYAKVRTVRSF